MTRSARKLLHSLLVIILVAPVLVLADISVSVEPDPPVMQESFRIVFTSDAKVDGEPDFSPLAPLFEILGQNRGTSVNWINGRHSRTTTWQLEVISQKAGDIVIPAIKFGSDSSPPTRITVADKVPGRTDQAQDLILEIEVDESQPYVQQQVLLTARLFRRVEWSDAQLSEPNASGDAIFKQLSEDKTYQGQRDGRGYEVFERRFALYPQASGKLTIEPLVLTAQIARQSRSFFDPFRATTSLRRVQSNALELTVRPVPSAFSGQVWLPARRLKLREEWEPEGSETKTGEPLTRTLFLWADGLNAGQLPDFPPFETPNANVYPDQPQTSEQENESGFNAVKQQKFAIIPSQTGALEFPAIEIPWWDTDTDTMQIARIDARRIDVLPAANGAVAAPPLADVGLRGVAPEQPAATDTTIAVGAPAAHPWPSIALVAAAGWLLTGVAWLLTWLRSRRSKTSDPDETRGRTNQSLARLKRDVLAAAKANDPAACRNALIAWARGAYQTELISTLHDVAQRASSPLGESIITLNTHLYGRAGSAWSGESLIEAFNNNELAAQTAEPDETSSQLKPLFRLS